MNKSNFYNNVSKGIGVGSAPIRPRLLKSIPDDIEEIVSGFKASKFDESR